MTVWSGHVDALHLAPRSFLPMKAAGELLLIAGKGVEGDRYATGEGFYSDRPEEGRQVTLFEVETLEALLRDHQVTLGAADHRRNVTTRNVPLNHLVGHRFRIGGTVLEGTRLSTPCRHIEQITGQEIFTLLLNRSGLHARILRGGRIRLGDAIMPE
ncbi:MOSC domain-containing protein [Mesorhizobium sp. L-8-3]|uniref:MOSC domain-containing protein n=1 Tax=Mesorhizobium sp. L-8-3 TaxID=2744522 RepID=UPI0019263C27|nr:MOSC domain-containing protein [Mesorhizobium sp. L-8-3]BCH24160.1 molybdenum cofactor biosysynthesis protein [Mesorhizobium sp. L-8-3]